MDRKKAILNMGVTLMVGFSILIVILIIEAVYFNFSHGVYIVLGVIICKLALAGYAKRTIDRINREYPKEDLN